MLGILAGVVMVCVTVAVLQWNDLRHREWRRKFEAEQKPAIDASVVAKAADAALEALSQRVVDLEKKANAAALKSLGTR